MTELRCDTCVLRPWRAGDEASLQRNADNYNVWCNLTDRFPHPYTMDDARWWIEHTATVERVGFAIEVDGQAVGGIGCAAKPDVYRLTGEVGYWLGEPHWGRGIVTEAVRAFVPYVFDSTDLVRLEAGVFDRNTRSARVLEKNGFVFEGRLTRGAFKDGVVMDVLLYARLRK